MGEGLAAEVEHRAGRGAASVEVVTSSSGQHKLLGVRLLRLLPLFVAIGCSAPRVDSPPSPPAALQPAGNDLVRMASGATLVAPKGWSVVASADAVTLVDPEHAATLTIVERNESDALVAIAAAWERAHPGFSLAPGEADAPPPTGGWDAIVSVDYAPPAAAHRTASALARRWGMRTWVALVEGDTSAVQRRGAQIETALGSLRPSGMKDESFVGEKLRPIDEASARRLDAFLGDALARLEVPGAAVAIIQGKNVVYERAFGVREIGKPEPISSKTLFLLGSITKPMTTMMQAALVDAKVLDWDTLVTKLMPSFTLGDAAVTQKVALWHTSCACTGMPRQDLEDLFEYAGVTPEARIASMRTMKPTTGFGETFQYSNLMVAAGGFAAARAFAPGQSLGEAYARAMREKLFTPIGMPSATLDFDVVERSEHASPHALALDGTTRALPLAIEKNVILIAPAGGVWMDLADFERYAQVELARGLTREGKRVVSEANVMARRTVRVRSGATDGYGLGINVSALAGLTTIGHDGGAFGYGTTLFLLPDQEIGILVLSNVRNGGGYEQLPFNRTVVRKIIEELFASAKDIAAPSLRYYLGARRRSVVRKSMGVERTPDAAWLARIAGQYTNASLGKILISGTNFDVGEWKTSFGRRVDHGTSKIVLLDPPLAGGEITVDEGDPPKLIVDDGQSRYVFTR